jgi:hypothetical protein
MVSLDMTLTVGPPDCFLAQEGPCRTAFTLSDLSDDRAPAMSTSKFASERQRGISSTYSIGSFG